LTIGLFKIKIATTRITKNYEYNIFHANFGVYKQLIQLYINGRFDLIDLDDYRRISSKAKRGRPKKAGTAFERI
jgi:hypothetical protein